MKRFFLAATLPVAALAVVLGLWFFASDRGQTNHSGSTRSETDATPLAENGLPHLAPESNVCQGILHRPDPGAARVFPAEYTQRRESNGIIIVGNGAVDPKAMDAAAATVERLFENNDLETPLAAEGAYVIVAAKNQGVLDLPEFKCIDNSANQDFFSHVCGVADRADYPVVTVGEEDLLGDRSGPCAGLNILFHELGHLVQGWTLGPADYIDIKLLYQDALDAGKYARDYASTNSDEYFAEATQAYFLSSDVAGRHDRAWLETYDPQIYALVSRVYGE
jgi:hypothetical protein